MDSAWIRFIVVVGQHGELWWVRMLSSMRCAPLLLLSMLCLTVHKPRSPMQFFFFFLPFYLKKFLFFILHFPVVDSLLKLTLVEILWRIYVSVYSCVYMCVCSFVKHVVKIFQWHLKITDVTLVVIWSKLKKKAFVYNSWFLFT